MFKISNNLTNLLIPIFKQSIKLKHHNSSLIVNRFETVLHLKLNRPEKRNCLNYDMIKRINDELIEFQKNNDLKTVILTGSDGNFCSGIDENEIDNEKTLLSLSNLLQLFPLNKPSIVGIEGYVHCAGLQLALAFDYKIIENDTYLKLDKNNHLPLHKYIKYLYSEYELIELLSDNKLSIKELVNKNIFTRNCNKGCCFGVSLEIGKCMEKFLIESIIYDRNKLNNLNYYNKDNLIKILNNDNVYTRINRFLTENIGKHASSQTDTLKEIYDKWRPKLVQENEL